VIQEAAFPEGGWRIAETTSIIGGVLVAQGRFNEAQPLLLDALRVMESDSQAPKRRTQNALARIINLYETWGKTDEAAKWRSKSK
jgi:hypothetical protein